MSASVLSSFTHRRLGSTGVLWLILLSALCAGLAVLGISRLARQEPAATEPVAEASPENPAAAESLGTEVGEEPVIEGGMDSRVSETAATREPVADDPAAPDTEPDGAEADVVTSVKPQANRPERRSPEPSMANEPETRKMENRDIAPPSVPRTQRRITRAERPRVVPPPDLPSVVTIESVFTGIPADRRRRGRDRWVNDDDYDYDEEFRRRMRRMRRENRRPFPF